MSESGLLPCPFCGGDAEVWLREGSIYCGECEGGVTNYNFSEGELIMAWNTRDSSQTKRCGNGL